MQLIYEGKDIAASVGINKADITDNAGGIADSLELYMNDTIGLWSSWKPQKNNVVNLGQSGLTSGGMYVDELEQERGFYIIRALSIPQEAKTRNTKCWEDVRFMEFSGEIANKYGFELQTYGIDNYLYSRLDQNELADFEFLAYRCMLEGYMLKITDKKVIIYGEMYLESLAVARTIYLSDIDGAYKFKTKSNGIYGACELTRGMAKSEYPAKYGPTLKINNIDITNQGEADRYTKNILRFYNKQETTGKFNIKLDTGITAGNTIQIAGAGMADGKYFCEQAVHRLVEKKTSLRLRKVLEGY